MLKLNYLRSGRQKRVQIPEAQRAPNIDMLFRCCQLRTLWYRCFSGQAGTDMLQTCISPALHNPHSVAFVFRAFLLHQREAPSHSDIVRKTSQKIFFTFNYAFLYPEFNCPQKGNLKWDKIHTKMTQNRTLKGRLARRFLGYPGIQTLERNS